MTAPWQRGPAPLPTAPGSAAGPGPAPRPDSRPGPAVRTPSPSGPVDAAQARPEPGHAPGAGQPAGAGHPADDAVPAEVSTLAAAVAGLDRIADLPVAEHVERYDALHGTLSDALASIDGV